LIRAELELVARCEYTEEAVAGSKGLSSSVGNGRVLTVPYR